MSSSSLPVAVVTGASQGVGLAVTTLLLDAGYFVYAQYNTTIAELQHPHLQWWHADFGTDITLPAQLAAETEIEALILCAGVARLGSTHDQPLEEWKWHMDVNLYGPIALTQLLLPQLQAAAGQVIYVNSGAGMTTAPQWGAYAASKHAARAWCEALRQETPEIRVSSIYPGRIATHMQRKIRAQEKGEYTAKKYLQAATVARTIMEMLQQPADAYQIDVILRPR